mmetsp:Transcript_5802/g.36024  ORF Transcript_5802/g.36024 Transcript_5802/m.36024 type:complete len:80 (+) Transcript_5802:118-357(+)
MFYRQEFAQIRESARMDTTPEGLVCIPLYITRCCLIEQTAELLQMKKATLLSSTKRPSTSFNLYAVFHEEQNRPSKIQS